MIKIFVPVKRVIDPNVNLHITPGEKTIAHQTLPHILNPFDEVALAKAVSLRAEGLVEEIVAVSIGPEKAEQILRTALAMGADRALHIVTRKGDRLLPFDIARILAKVFTKEQPRLVLMGKQAVDSDAGQTGALLAGFLGLPFLPDTAELELNEKIATTAFVQNACHIRAKTELPAIISCELHLFEPRPISLPQMMQAKRKPIESQPLAELDTPPTSNLSRVQLLEPKSRPVCRLFDGVDDLAEHLQEERLWP